jgi:PAS domain S-box-containing protein
VLKRALEQLARVLPFDTSTVLLTESDSLRIAACWGFEKPEELIGATFQVEEDNISHRVMRSQQVRVVDDVQKLPEWGHNREDLEGYQRIRAWIGASLIVREQSIGLLVLDSFEPEFFTEEDGEVVAAFATQIAIAIHNARLYEATEKQRDRLTAILTDTTDAIIVLNTAGDIWLMNPAARRNLKIHREDLIGLPVSVLGLPDLNKALATVQTTNEPSAGEITLTDGSAFHASIAPVTDVGWVVVMQDITPLKELDRLRTEWVAAVSHDLKNPIQMIQLGATLLEMDGPLNEVQHQRVNIIQRGAEQLRSLVVDVLDLARLEAGPSLNLAELNVEELIKKSLSEVEHLAMKKQQQITSHISTSLPSIYGDNVLLQRALSNLLLNAIKYTPNEGKITVEASTSGEHMRFEVSDNGKGIPASSLPYLFDRFYRVPNTEAEGTGLGLSIVKSIVEKHSGAIEVASIEGQGSTFAITLPIGHAIFAG